MNPYTGTLLGYLCLSLFLVFALGPFTGQRMVHQTEPVVFLSAVALTQPAQKPVCVDQAIQLNQEALRPFPEIKEAVEKLGRSPIGKNEVRLSRGNLGPFIKQFTGKEQRVLERGQVYS